MKSKLYLFISFLILIPITQVSAQSETEDLSMQVALQLTVFNNDDDDDPNPFYDGELKLKNGDRYEGAFSLNNFADNGKYIVIGNVYGCKEVFSNKDIAYVIFYEGSNHGQTKFVHTSQDSRMYRLVFENLEKDIKVYDSSSKPYFDHLVNEVFVEEKNQLINTFNFWGWGAKHDLVRYINHRDGTNYKNRKLKTPQEVFELL